STGARFVKKEVFGQLNGDSISYQTITTRFPDTEANIDDIASRLVNGDMVISAAGDGTASQVANAILVSGVDAEVGFLPYGNFNDLALSHMNQKDSVTDLVRASAAKVIPLYVELDGKPWRYAPGYTTIGSTALLANQFSTDQSRKLLRFAPRSLKIAASLAQLADTYFRTRNDDLPPFTTTEKSQLAGQPATDIIAINSPHVARMVRLQKLFYDSTEFGYKEINMAQFLRNVPFGIRALTSGAPLEMVNNSISVHFDEPVKDLLIQTEGEFAHVSAQDVTISKSLDDFLSVLHTKR
ncbi:MAG: diacylglycerol kinase family protein, partial [Candidatus Saccharimonas sp.]